MTNVYATPEKVETKGRLFEIGVETLRKQGWKVERVPKMGKASVRRISKGTESKVVSIRTTQDQYIAFPRTADDKGWVTLSDVEAVVAVSVDDRENPKHALVHLIDGDDMRDRFDRTYAARKQAGHVIPIGRGVWLSLYDKEIPGHAALVGAGAGLDYPAIATVPLQVEQQAPAATQQPAVPPDLLTVMASDNVEAPLTIPEAKRRLAATLGVPVTAIEITIRG